MMLALLLYIFREVTLVKNSLTPKFPNLLYGVFNTLDC